jgi:hypothetical protein
MEELAQKKTWIDIFEEKASKLPGKKPCVLGNRTEVYLWRIQEKGR